MNKNKVDICKEEIVNNNDYRLELNNFIKSMISLINKEWLGDFIIYEEIEYRGINIIDFIKVNVLSNLIYLNKTHEWNYKDIIMLTSDLLKLIDEQVVMTILWKNKIIKLWKNINYKYWYEINWNKNRVFLKQNNDYLIELNIWTFLKNFLNTKGNIKNEENSFVFNLHLNNDDLNNVNDIFNSLKNNTKKYNFNHGWEYKINWNFKDFLEKN